MQRAGIGLNVHRQGLARRGLGKELNVPMVHIGALGHLAIDKDQELGILTVVPLFNLGADFHPHGLSRHFLGNGDVPPEPIVRALDPLEVSLVALKFSFKLVAAIVDRIPVHTLAVEILPGTFTALRLFGAEEETWLILPVGQLPAVPHAQRLQLVTNHLNSFVNKVHCNPPRRKFLLRRLAAPIGAYRLFSLT